MDHTVAQSVADAGLGDHLERIGRVDHDEAMRHMQRARVLLLLVNDTPNLMGILPGKVFEYLSVGRPILAIGPVKGDVARVLADASHLVIDRAGTISGQSRIKQVFNASPANTVDIYSRRGLTMQVAELLGTVAEA
ncbi:MAG: hypothetical protein IPH53_20845 [Flavobacteriales bacterium]|nr:hypothetical protein [Flavobacteriales bacterium]